MNLQGLRANPTVSAAMVCSAAVTAQFIAGKAMRDALFLAHYDVTTLPAMVAATSAVSILLAFANSQALSRVAPGVFVPFTFVAGAVLLLAEWLLFYAAPKLAAGAVYLQVSGIGPMLGSGFWLIVGERFDPRTAKQHFGRIAGAGTLGGLAGGLLAERIAAGPGIAAMLPILALLNMISGWLIFRLAAPERRLGRSIPDGMAPPIEMTPAMSPSTPRSGLRLLRDARYLRSLAALVLLGTAGAALMDYAFKAAALSHLGSGDALLRFFAIYYSATSFATFLVQASLSGVALQQLGLAVSVGTPAAALLAGGLGALFIPGLGSATIARGGESIFRGSLFRAGYEIFYTPIPARERRAAKSLIDVGFDRLGDAVGSALVRLALLLSPAYQASTILGLAVSTSAAALVVARSLQRGYIQTLERSLLNRALELDLADVEDMTSRTVMLRTLTSVRLPAAARPGRMAAGHDDAETQTGPQPVIRGDDARDADLQVIRALRSRDRAQILSVLHADEGLPAAAIPDVITLLAWDPIAEDAADALRRVAEERIGQLADALIDPNQEFAIRRRLARVFSVCVSQRAADAAMLGLDDQRFEVRLQCARSLVAIVEKNPRVRINADVIFEVGRRETAVGRPVWESHRLLNLRADRDDHVFVDDFVKDLASYSLAHVFTLLSLALPPEPVRIAFRGLHTDDPALQGLALEYLEGVLPPTIRTQLWPYLETRRPGAGPPARTREQILADLVRSHQSILVNLEELQRREKDAATRS
jgi:hypothetical protein